MLVKILCFVTSGAKNFWKLRRNYTVSLNSASYHQNYATWLSCKIETEEAELRQNKELSHLEDTNIPVGIV